jgi:6,7-dimethyl-8-ribityllumazine synthase
MGVDFRDPDAPRPDPARGDGRKIGILATQWNDVVVRRLLRGAFDLLADRGVAEGDVDVTWVPGAFELPLAAQALAHTGCYDGLVALGCVIRGDTPHFDYVAGPCADGIARVQLDTGVPIGFGVLTVESRRQALVRSVVEDDVAGDNKGDEAAATVLEMIAVLTELRDR